MAITDPLGAGKFGPLIVPSWLMTEDWPVPVPLTVNTAGAVFCTASPTGAASAPEIAGNPDQIPGYLPLSGRERSRTLRDSAERAHRGRQSEHRRPAHDLRRYHQLHPIRDWLGVSANRELAGRRGGHLQSDVERAAPRAMDIDRRRGVASLPRLSEV